MNENKQLKRIAAGVEALQPAARPRDSAREPRAERLPLMGAIVLRFGGSDKRNARASRIRRTFPLRAYVGPNGGGKSLCMVADALYALDRGRRVLSTVTMLDSRTGLPHPAFEQFTDFDQLLDATHTTVLMDEVVGIANSRESGKLPPALQNKLVQLRRGDVDLSWSAPSWARADKIIREVTQAVTECRGYFPAGMRVDAAGEPVLWAPRRVFRFRTFDTIDFEEWTAAKRDRIEPIASTWFKGAGSRAFASYDTLDAVSIVASATDGACDTCGGVRRPKACRCDARAPRPVAARAEAAERTEPETLPDAEIEAAAEFLHGERRHGRRAAVMHSTGAVTV